MCLNPDDVAAVDAEMATDESPGPFLGIDYTKCGDCEQAFFLNCPTGTKINSQQGSLKALQSLNRESRHADPDTLTSR